MPSAHYMHPKDPSKPIRAWVEFFSRFGGSRPFYGEDALLYRVAYSVRSSLDGTESSQSARTVGFSEPR